MCAGTRLCVCVYVYVLGQWRVRVLYIAITLLFLPLTVIAKMIAGGEFWWGGGLLQWRRGDGTGSREM